MAAILKFGKRVLSPLQIFLNLARFDYPRVRRKGQWQGLWEGGGVVIYWRDEYIVPSMHPLKPVLRVFEPLKW